jgi:hypothetical protein
VVNCPYLVARMPTKPIVRRSRNETVALRKSLTAMLTSVEAHARAIKESGLTPGAVPAKVRDCRDLSHVASATIDAVVTSPPYSIALDYVKNDEHALEALGVDIGTLREVMTGRAWPWSEGQAGALQRGYESDVRGGCAQSHRQHRISKSNTIH